jgi:hypothetical protein
MRWIPGVMLDFLAEMANMGFDQTSVSVIAKSPEMRDNLVRSTDIVRIGDQQIEQFTLRWGQAHGFVIDSGFIVKMIYTERSNA